MGTLDLNDIRTFVAIEEAGTLTGTAKQLNVPVSTISRSLTRLEKQLGVLLVHRSPRGLVITDCGRDYVQSCRRALRVLKEGSDLLEGQRTKPGGLIRVACPIHMAREALAPLMVEFLSRFPDLRVDIQTYSSGWDQEPREDVDVFFKLRAPRDSLRRVRPYPGTVRGLFASHQYVRTAGTPVSPDDLSVHTCIGSGVWKLNRGGKVTTPNISFRVGSSDPAVNMKMAVEGLGIVILPLYMAKRMDVHDLWVPILPGWSPDPIMLCALFFEPSRLTPKIRVLLDFLGEYLGTNRDPRLPNERAKGYFTDPILPAASGPPAF